MYVLLTVYTTQIKFLYGLMTSDKSILTTGSDEPDAEQNFTTEEITKNNATACDKEPDLNYKHDLGQANSTSSYFDLGSCRAKCAKIVSEFVAQAEDQIERKMLKKTLSNRCSTICTKLVFEHDKDEEFISIGTFSEDCVAICTNRFEDNSIDTLLQKDIKLNRCASFDDLCRLAPPGPHSVGSSLQYCPCEAEQPDEQPQDFCYCVDTEFWDKLRRNLKAVEDADEMLLKEEWIAKEDKIMLLNQKRSQIFMDESDKRTQNDIRLKQFPLEVNIYQNPLMCICEEIRKLREFEEIARENVDKFAAILKSKIGPEAGQRKQAAGGEADCVCTNSGKPGGCAAVSNEVEKRQLNPETDCICKKKEAAPPKEKKECSTDTKKKPMADAGEGEEMMCACDPSDAETKNIQDELIIKLNKAQEEILTLQMEMAKLQRMEADKKSKSAILYKEIMKGVDDCPTTCPGRSTPQFPQQSARPQSPPPGKNSSRQSSDPAKDDCYCPREQSSARTQTAAMPYGGSPYGKNPAMNMRSPQQYGGYPGQQMVQCVYKRPTGVAGDEYGGQQYQQPYSPQYGGYGQSTYQSAQIPCGTPQKPCPKQKSSSSQKGPCGTPQKICPSQQVGYDMYQGAQDGSGIVCYDYPDVPQGYDMMGGYQMQPYEDYGEEDDPCDNYTCGNEDCDNYSG